MDRARPPTTIANRKPDRHYSSLLKKSVYFRARRRWTVKCVTADVQLITKLFEKVLFCLESVFQSRLRRLIVVVESTTYSINSPALTARYLPYCRQYLHCIVV